jgi:hypothetical protein
MSDPREAISESGWASLDWACQSRADMVKAFRVLHISVFLKTKITPRLREPDEDQSTHQQRVLASSGKRCTSSILAKLICKNVLYY